MAHEARFAPLLTYEDNGEPNAVTQKPPLSAEDWNAKRVAVDTVLDEVKGVATRVGDETVGEMWSSSTAWRFLWAGGTGRFCWSQHELVQTGLDQRVSTGRREL